MTRWPKSGSSQRGNHALTDAKGFENVDCLILLFIAEQTVRL